jgi:hypothetical protein
MSRDPMSEAVERMAAAEAAREVIERLFTKLGMMTEEDADAWSRAVAAEHFADSPDQGYGVYESLVSYARVARERGD